MCQSKSADLPSPPETVAAARPACGPGAAAALPAGSRRRRLWELDHQAHCPVIGVCLPMAALRRLTDKVPGGQAPTSDYALHCRVVAECRQRNRLSEALHKQLDQRFALALRRAATIKCSDGLAAWWAEASAGHALPGALWAVLTHARCTPHLAQDVLSQVHMLQQQLGMATRVELQRFEALIDENAVLSRELAAAQGRSLRQASLFAQRVDELEAALVRQRALTMAGQTELAQQREALAALEAAVPQLAERHALAAQAAGLQARVQDLQRALSQARADAQRLRQRAEAPWPPVLAPTPAAVDAVGAPHAPPGLADRAVLCVGGRPASVPLYRLVVERTGGRFLHHDGGDEDNPARLDATLGAADLVICQTGCVSHAAYWRVKDHCKRTGKRCLFVETPSRAALERALADAVAPASP